MTAPPYVIPVTLLRPLLLHDRRVEARMRVEVQTIMKVQLHYEDILR